MKFILIYITCRDEKEAVAIAESVVREKLAACANIIPGIKSIYMWNESLQNDSEYIVILKSTSELFTKIETQVKTLHSYSNPCIVALDIATGAAPFLNWISGSVSNASTSK